MTTTQVHTLTELNMLYFREKIYYELDSEEIEHIKQILCHDIIGISVWQRTLMLIAINDRQQKSQEIKRIAKTYMKQYPEDKEQLKILKKLFSEKRKIFDNGFYDEVLGWHRDCEIVKKYVKTK